MAKPEDLMAPAASLVNLGPFNPPTDYEFEEELQGEPPRRRTPDLSMGPLAVRRRKTVSGLLIAAAICTTIAPLPFVQECGLYLVPLQYLQWIGVGLGVVAICQFVFDRLVRGPYRYAEDAHPLIARIRSVNLRVSREIHGTPVYRFYVLLEFRHPESGELRTIVATTRELSVLNVAVGYTTTYRVGDYVTAVYFPGKFEKSLRLYGFLELKPGLGLIRCEEARELTARRAALWFACIFGLIVILLWHLNIISKYWPLDVDPGQGIAAFVIGAVVLGGGFLAWQVSRKRRDRAVRDGSTAEEVVQPGRPWRRGLIRGLFSALVTLSIGGVMMLCWCCAANGLLDDSPPIYRPVQIDRMVSVTHHGIFREYKMEYHFLDGDPKHSDILSTPSKMAEFRGDRAVAEMHVGCLGWPWIKAIHPLGKLP